MLSQLVFIIFKINFCNSYCFLCRLLWREYLTQVVHAQNNSNQNSTQETENDASAQQERIRYRYQFHVLCVSFSVH